MIKRSLIMLSLIICFAFIAASAADNNRHVPTIDELLTIKTVGGG